MRKNTKSPSLLIWKATAWAVTASLIVLIVATYLDAYLPSDILDQGVSATSAFVTSIATIYAIIAGFTILIAFDRFKTLSGGVDQELAILGDILDLTQYLDNYPRDAEELKEKTYTYARSIANDEWEAMQKGERSPQTTAHLAQLMQSVNKIPVHQQKDAILVEALMMRMTNLTTLRAARIAGATQSLPSLLLVSLYVVSITTSLAVILLPFPNIIVQRFFVVSIVFIVALIQNFVIDIGNPFAAGIWQIKKDDFINIKTSIVGRDS